MKPLNSLRTRLILTYASLIVIGFGGLALLAGRQISAAAVVDYQQALQSQAALVAQGMAEVLEHFAEGEARQADVQRVAESYASQTNARLTLVDTTGRAWLDNQFDPPLENQATFAEVRAAMGGRAGSDIRPDEHGALTLYVAVPITEEGHLMGVVRLSAPVEATRVAVLRRWLALGIGVALLTLLTLAASLWLATSLTRPLEQLRTSALRLATGDLSQRLPENRTDEIGQLAIAFNYLAAQVQAMLDEQRAFASNASHELRTPLTAIRLRSEALRSGALNGDTARQYIVEIDDEVARLGRLVDDLILLSRLDANRAEPGSEQIDPLRLARSLAREFAPQMETRRITLVIDAPSDLPGVQASLNHVRIVFRNLLDNAIKYTPPDGRVTWRLWAEEGFLRAAITDTGQGIDPADLPHLFQRFYRADKARTRDVPGSGLGLSIACSVVEFYGGRLAIDSPGVGQGTTADVWWPLPASGQGGGPGAP